MLFSSKPLTSALVAIVTLSIAVSASLDSVEQHLASRDATTFQSSKEASGKLATPVDLTKTNVSPQAVFQLTGQDLHSVLPDSALDVTSSEQSAVAVPGKASPAALAAVANGDDPANRGHCSLGQETINIKRIRYTMRMQVDSDESGVVEGAGADSLHGVVVKATSGLYSTPNPDKGSCAKTLARHGENCANRPYIVPQSMVPSTAPGTDSGADAGTGKAKPDSKEPAYHAGPYITKRSSPDVQPLGDWKKADRAADLVFKRGETDATAAAPRYRTDLMSSGAHTTISGPGGSICIDTVKRDKQVTKVVPTRAHKTATREPGAPLHFELVRSDDKANTWNQIIYNANGEPIDITHLSITSNMSFWRAEYYCADCKEGHRKHTVVYEDVEMEVDVEDEHKMPKVQCDGQAQSTNVHKRVTSKYAHKNRSGVEYSGAIFSIDRVGLGEFDVKGKGDIAIHSEGHVQPISGSIPATGRANDQEQPPSGEESKTTETPEKPGSVNKREVIVEQDGPIF